MIKLLMATGLLTMEGTHMVAAGSGQTFRTEYAARDSVALLPALLGKSDTGRTELLEHLYGGPHCALRIDNWKLVDGQLYDLSADLSEKKNLAQEQPDRAKAMAARLKELQTTTRTRP